MCLNKKNKDEKYYKCPKTKQNFYCDGLLYNNYRVTAVGLLFKNKDKYYLSNDGDF